MVVQFWRCSRPVSAVATVCAVLWLLEICSCATDQSDEALDKQQLTEFYKKGLFILESEPLKRCITVDRSNLVLDNCERPTRSMLWKWVSQHRLFNLGTSTCLGLNLSNKTQPLGTFRCDTALSVLWWRCNGKILQGASQWKVAVTGRLVVVKRNVHHLWKRYNTDREGPCSRPYEDIHTLLGNAHGMPCALPFKYNNKWYYECTAEGVDDHLLWCATSTHYDDAKKWGFCPVQGYSCDQFWETNQKLQACYQFNLYTILTWSQAQSTCQAQGGNLLSVTSLAEQSYIRDRLASIGAMVWIGLNHLKDGRGWQWSDGAPLSLVNFTTALPASPLQDNRQCGVYNSAYEGHWQSLSCESALPYICKKTPNNTRRAEPLENWQYIHTECSSGWWPHKGFCYRLLSETKGTWKESSEACNSRGANLTSIRSLSEVEMLLDLLANYSGDSTEVWIGLWKRGSSPNVEWSDGSPVALTLWHQYHPPPNQTDILCAKADRKEGNWLLVSCDERLPALCRRKSLTPIHHRENLDTGCPENMTFTVWIEQDFGVPSAANILHPEVVASLHSRHHGGFRVWLTSVSIVLVVRGCSCALGWKRHRHSCYTVTNQEQINEDARIGYYCHGHLLTVEDRFEQAFVNSLLSASGANSSLYYWIGLMSTGDDDEDGDGGLYIWDRNTDPPVPLTFTNWNKHQPVSGSGCVVMSGGPELGRWEVKNCRTFKALSLCKQSVHDDSDFQLPQHFNHPNAPCPPGWESQAELLLCFKVFHDEKVLMKRSWVEADFFCQALGAQLTSFTHYKEQMFVKQLLSTMFDGTEGRSFWVGLNKRDPEHPGGWEWSDGTPVVTTFIEDKAEDDDRRLCAVYSYMTNAFVPQLCDAKHEWICKIAKGEKLKKPYWYIEHSEPWMFYHGAEYLLVQQPFDWDSVSLACQMMGAYLLSIHSREELHFVKEHLRRLSLGPTDWWIGLSIGPPGEEVRWSDRTEVEFQNWAQASALGARRDRTCATMSSSSGKWSRSKCNELHGYVCKRKTVSVLETPREPHYIGRCPEKWLYFGHKCLLLHLPSSPKEGKTWKDAESICSSFESSLVTIDSEIEQAFITMLLQGSAVGVWISLKWTGYRNWSPIECDLTEEPLCTVLSNNHNVHMTGKWYDEKCSESGYGFVCQKPQDTSKSPTHAYHHPLPTNIEYRGHNYRVISGNLSWYDAMVMCRESHFDLVSIMDAYHQAFLTVLVNRLGAPHWIGLHSELAGGISYRWSDGSETVYTHWDAEDDEDSLTEDCVYVDVNGRWRRADCETSLPGALCQEAHASSKPFISNEVVCPTTWVKFGQICYNFDPVVYQLTFEKSREHCRLMANNSDVLTVMSDKENRFVLEQLWTLGLLHQTVWLGMDFNQDNNSMVWMDGSPVDYNNWPNKSPDPKLVSADTCVTTRGLDGVWHLSQCTEQLGFICKTTTKANDMVEVEPLKGFHHSAIPAAVLGAVLIFALLAGATWLAYKKNALCFRGLPPIGSIYYRQSGTHTDSDGNVLITDLSPYSGQ